MFVYLLKMPGKIHTKYLSLFLWEVSSRGEDRRHFHICTPYSLVYGWFFFLIFMLYWSIVDLLYCVSFRWTAKWFSYTWICFSSDSFPYWLLQNIEQRSLCYTVGRALLIICDWSFYNLVLFIKLNQRKQEGRLQERCVTGVRELIWARALWVL